MRFAATAAAATTGISRPKCNASFGPDGRSLAGTTATGSATFSSPITRWSPRLTTIRTASRRPLDSRLPGGGGYQVCGLYDIKPGKFGQVNSVVTQSDNFGKQRLVNDFFSVSLNARLGADLQFGGGVDTGRTVNDLCFNVDSPGAAAGNVPAIYSAFGPAVQLPGAAITINGQRNCRVVTPFRGSDAGEGLRDIHPAEGLRRERDLAEHVGATRGRELLGAQRDHRAVARSRPVGRRPHRHGSADRPTDDVRGSVQPARLAVGQTHSR